jgi:c-di-GMP-binding flagellar brake protein YcgR
MDAIETIRGELEQLLSDISASGYANIDAGIMGRLDAVGAVAEKLGMKNGKKLIDNLTEVLKSFKEGKTEEKSVALRFTALEFYNSNIKAEAGEVEEL